MDALSKPFGTLHGVPVVGYYLENARGTRVCVLNLGGIVQDYSLRTDNGRLPLVIGYDNAADYVQNPFQINKQIGRVAGRIAGAAFDLFGKPCRVEANEGRNALHGGSHGLAGTLFTVQRLDAQLLRLSTTVTAAQDGYPGDLELSIDYQLDADDRLTLRYEATAHGDTVFDPTLHIYWRLPRGLHGCTLHIPQGEHIAVDAEKLPLNADDNPAYDFRHARPLDDAVRASEGFDDIYRVPADIRQAAAILSTPDYRVRLYGDRNGLIIFTAAPQDGTAHDAGTYDTLATELQTLPNSLHRPEYGDIRLKDGARHQSTIIFQPERGH